LDLLYLVVAKELKSEHQGVDRLMTHLTSYILFHECNATYVAGTIVGHSSFFVAIVHRSP
jgi:hypothetical protein